MVRLKTSNVNICNGSTNEIEWQFYWKKILKKWFSGLAFHVTITAADIASLFCHYYHITSKLIYIKSHFMLFENLTSIWPTRDHKRKEVDSPKIFSWPVATLKIPITQFRQKMAHEYQSCSTAVFKFYPYFI